MNKRQRKKIRQQACEWVVRAFCLSPKKGDFVVLQLPSLALIEDPLRIDELQSILKKLFSKNQVLILSDEIKVSIAPKDQLFTLHAPQLEEEKADEIKRILEQIKNEGYW